MAGALPPRYVDFKEAIRTEMFAVRQKMGELRALHGRAALTRRGPRLPACLPGRPLLLSSAAGQAGRAAVMAAALSNLLAAWVDFWQRTFAWYLRRLLHASASCI